MSTQFITKMSVKSLGAKPSRAKIEEKKLPMVDIYGVATGVGTGVDAKGDAYEYIEGTFEGINHEDGNILQSGKLFLPDGIHQMVAANFHVEVPPTSVEFAIRIYAFPAQNPIGYSYSAENLIETDAKDSLSDLRAKIGAPALESTNVKKLAKK